MVDRKFGLTKRAVLAALVATSTAVTAPGAARAATNLLTDGSFENGLTGWTLSGKDAQNYPEVVIPYNVSAAYPNGAYNETIPTATGSASPDAAGTHGLYFVSDLATETISQTVKLGPGTYDVGLSLYAPRNGWNNAGDAVIASVAGGTTLLSTDVHSLTPQKWYDVTGTFTAAAAGDYTFNFSFDTSHVPSADVVIDQVYIVADSKVSGPAPVVVQPDEAPLPILGASPAALAAIGGWMFAAKRRRS